MQHILFNSNEQFVQITKACMLNPANKDFYIGNLTLDKLSALIDNDSNLAEVVFTAFGLAQAEYLPNPIEYTEIVETCPECGCTAHQGYISGIRCPNCDYED